MSRTPDGTGTVAVVTGAARGIGAAVALRLAAGGGAVVVVDRDEQDTAGTVAAVRRAGGRALGIGCDVAVAAEVRTAMLRIAASYGRLDVLVNCAGVTRDRLLLAMDDPEWDTVLDVSLGGTMRWSLAAAELMKHRGTGRIVTFSSVAADGNPGQTNYATAKAALAGFTRALASELGPHGITVNAVAPGFVATPMVEELADRLGVDREAFLKEAASRAAVGRVGTVDDIAAVVAFLAGRESGYLTGQTVSVDGGRR